MSPKYQMGVSGHGRAPRGRLRRRGCGGYSLIEVMVAASIIMTGVAAAAQMSLVMTQQEESAFALQRGMGLGEAAHRLYQLGLSTGEVVALLPPDPAVTVQAASSTLDTSAIATVEATDWSVRVTARPGTSDVRILTIKSVRPSIR